MDTAMTQEELEEMLDRAVREVTEQTAGVRLQPGGKLLGKDLCTVHISFRRVPPQPDPVRGHRPAGSYGPERPGGGGPDRPGSGGLW